MTFALCCDKGRDVTQRPASRRFEFHPAWRNSDPESGEEQTSRQPSTACNSWTVILAVFFFVFFLLSSMSPKICSLWVLPNQYSHQINQRSYFSKQQHCGSVCSTLPLNVCHGHPINARPDRLFTLFTESTDMFTSPRKLRLKSDDISRAILQLSAVLMHCACYNVICECF